MSCPVVLHKLCKFCNFLGLDLLTGGMWNYCTLQLDLEHRMNIFFVMLPGLYDSPHALVPFLTLRCSIPGHYHRTVTVCSTTAVMNWKCPWQLTMAAKNLRYALLIKKSWHNLLLLFLDGFSRSVDFCHMLFRGCRWCSLLDFWAWSRMILHNL